jgi:glycosyltransferase involved in cell wall biosynthesis
MRLDTELSTVSWVFVLSSYQAQTFIDEGVARERLIRMNLGVDVDLFKQSIRDEHRGFNILFVGQLTQRKGLSYLLHAFTRANISRSQLTLVGRPVGNALSMLEGRPSVRFKGHVSRQQLPAEYAAADVFVLPSLVEGFPLTALEAMACGLPVIVSENTFGLDVITDGVDGFVVPIRDSDAIAERLLTLAADPELRRKMGEAAARRAQDFSWANYGQRISDAIIRVTKPGGPVQLST